MHEKIPYEPATVINFATYTPFTSTVTHITDINSCLSYPNSWSYENNVVLYWIEVDELPTII